MGNRKKEEAIELAELKKKDTIMEHMMPLDALIKHCSSSIENVM